MPNPTPKGHNGGVTPNTYYHHLKQWEGFKARQDKLKGEVSAWQKTAIDDGIDIVDMKAAIKRKGLSDAEQIASFNRQMFYLQCMNVPLANLVAPIDESAIGDAGMTDEQRRKRWEDEGYLSGKTGKGLDVAMGNHDPNSIAGRFIREGWDRGQKENAAGIKKKEPAADKKAAAPKADAPKADAKAASKPGKAAAVKVSYWHNPDEKAVQEVKDGSLPEKPWVSVPRGEFDTLKAEYEKQAEADFEAAKPKDGEVVVETPFDDEPPSPGAAKH